MTVDCICIEAVKISEDTIEIDLETYIIIHIFRICHSNFVKLKVSYVEKLNCGTTFTIETNDLIFDDVGEVPLIATYCKRPVVVVKNGVVAGLSSVARQIIKSSKNDEVNNLLGFREACLMACSENSIWTKFCEVDLVTTVKKVKTCRSLFIDCEEIRIPEDLVRFEHHLLQPVKVHNIYKLARIRNQNNSIASGAPLDNLNMDHKYAEGIYMTLSDVIIYPSLKILLKILGERAFSCLPKTLGWLKTMDDEIEDFLEVDIGIGEKIDDFCNRKIIVPSTVPMESLYSSDPKRYRPQSRIYTKDMDIHNALNIVENLEVIIANDGEPYGFEVPFDWNKIPMEANPEGGALPEKRAGRKCEQLENLAKAVLKIVGSKTFRIVDFCSGSGHLGIVIAVLLPQCKILLVENKERSLSRAKETIKKLALTNVEIVQSNLDYFQADFDLGVCLHACGVATDLVIQTCISKKAHFVACPCCYGGIKNCYHLTYPRSEHFKTLELKEYLNIAHAADQTHKNNEKTKQGFLCMDIIDTDRKFEAESKGYVVHLGKLQPETCTPKNNLLVGIYDTSKI